MGEEATEDIPKLVFSIVFCSLAGIIGSFFSSPGAHSDWFINLEKPFFNPPSIVFTLVWFFLYLLIAISAFLVWKDEEAIKKGKCALVFFLIQIILNSLWAIFFFVFESTLAGFISALVLWAVCLATLICFYRIRKLAAYLFFIYFLWVSFAVVLSYSIWQLN